MEYYIYCPLSTIILRTSCGCGDSVPLSCCGGQLWATWKMLEPTIGLPHPYYRRGCARILSIFATITGNSSPRVWTNPRAPTVVTAQQKACESSPGRPLPNLFRDWSADHSRNIAQSVPIVSGQVEGIFRSIGISTRAQKWCGHFIP